MVTVKTYRHITLEFHSNTLNSEEINKFANVTRDEIIQTIGDNEHFILISEKGKDVYWKAEKG